VRSRAVATGPTWTRRDVVGRGVAAVIAGVAVGEFVALVLFSGSIDRRLDEQAARNADSAFAVAQASDRLQQTRDARRALDQTITEARAHRDQALVIARCEYHPTPACPQTHITGVPGTGPETRTANELLAEAQRELDNAVADRDHRVPVLDAQLVSAEVNLAHARQKAIAGADRGLGARWTAMQDFTLGSSGALLLQSLTLAFFILLSLLPLILLLWRGETTEDRRRAARTERDRAVSAADTAIAVKRAEVRAAVEAMWAGQRLEQARLAVEAQTEIDRAQQRRRIAQALADQPAAELPAGGEAAAVAETARLPATIDPRAGRPSAVIPGIPDVTRAAARWIRPLVPTFLARAIDTTAQPLRTARHVLEEVEEITFSFKRIRRVIVDATETGGHPTASHARAAQHPSVGRAAPQLNPPLLSRPREQGHDLCGRDESAELSAGDELPRLPPAL